MTETVNTKYRRRPSTAISLSLVLPGLGQVYCGRLKRGLILTFLNLLPLPLIIWLCHSSPEPVKTSVIFLLILTGFIVQLMAICDSAWLAKKAGAEYELKEYNSLTVYVLLIFIVTGGALGSALYLREKAFEAFRIPTASCYPTILPGDRILANKSAYKTEDPKIGDLVVFTNPTGRRETYIKRVVAVAGDTVEIKDSKLYINDIELKREKYPDSVLDNIKINFLGKQVAGKVYEETNGDARYNIILTDPPFSAETYFEKTTIPQHYCFVLGDNRNVSLDSRNFGPLLLATVKGRVDYIYCPSKDWSRFGKIE